MDGSKLDAAPQRRRRSLRRTVQVETDVTNELWDGAIRLLGTDLSLHGVWLDSDLPLEPGSEVSISLLLPRMAITHPFEARARVAHVALSRRRTDYGRSGMGLCFVDVNADQSERLAHALIGLPPKAEGGSAGMLSPPPSIRQA
jgi:hypothetical protein